MAAYVVLAATPLTWGATDPAVAMLALCGLSVLGALLARRRGPAVGPRRWVTRSEAAVLALALALAALNRDPIAYYTLDGDNAVYAVRALQLWKEGGTTSPAVPALAADMHTVKPLWLPGTHPVSGRPDRYQFHALPAWPLVMSAALAVGGLAHQFDAQLLLYVLVVALGLLLLVQRVGPERGLPLAVLMATSPLLLFFSRYTTAELLALMLLLVALGCWSSGSVVLQWSALVPVTALAFTHMAFFVLLPAAGLAAAYGWARLHDPDARVYALAAGEIAVAQLAALPFYAVVSNQYAADILSAAFGAPATGNAILAISAVAVALLAAARLRDARHRSRLARGLARAAAWLFDRALPVVIPLGMLLVLAAVGVLAYRLGWTDVYFPKQTSEWNSWSARVAYVDKGAPSLLHLSFVSVLFAGSVVATLVAIAGLLRPPRFFRADRSLLPLFFLYALAVFTVARVDVPNNYYASRYFLPVLFPLLFASAAQALRSCRPATVWLISLAGVVGFNLYYDAALIRADFYSSGATPYRWLETQIPAGSRLLMVADPWLERTFALQARLLYGIEVEVVPAAPAPGRRHLRGEPQTFILDTSPGRSAAAVCTEYFERRIPWQILYPTTGGVVERQICVSASPPGDPP